MTAVCHPEGGARRISLVRDASLRSAWQPFVILRAEPEGSREPGMLRGARHGRPVLMLRCAQHDSGSAAPTPTLPRCGRGGGEIPSPSRGEGQGGGGMPHPNPSTGSGRAPRPAVHGGGLSPRAQARRSRRRPLAPRPGPPFTAAAPEPAEGPAQGERLGHAGGRVLEPLDYPVPPEHLHCLEQRRRRRPTGAGDAN